MNTNRIKTLNSFPQSSGDVVYWMSRDQRVEDNWALIFAQQLAQNQHGSCIVVFCLRKQFPFATSRLIDFMLKGLQEVEATLAKKHIPFYFLLGDPVVEIPAFIKTYNIAALITDFSPLKPYVQWKKVIAKNISVPCYEVDTHNIVPVWVASPKQEFAAYTFRPKIHKLLPEYLEEFPVVTKSSSLWKHEVPLIHWDKIYAQISADTPAAPVDWIMPGEKAAHQMLHTFLMTKLPAYEVSRNDPTLVGQSDLSPYLHFGHISAQRVALEVKKSSSPVSQKNAFLEELIVRKELSDNFCFYNDQYDSFEGFPQWAKKTLDEHRKDKRPVLYSKHQLEHAQTHDALWNASQNELIKKGKMHGYMRMYWAKKILEWSKTPEEALAIAIYLNDKYELDGRDPNGYVGIAWSIGGVHDRAWFERPIYGKIRYMNDNGARKKFAADVYIKRYVSI